MTDPDTARRIQAAGLVLPTGSTPTSSTDRVLDSAVIERHAEARIDWPTLWSREEADDWLIEPIIARGRGHALFAGAKSGKSLLMLYLLALAAMGRRVLDHRGGDPVRVLYVDLEMTQFDVRERLIDMGIGPNDDLSALAYYSMPSLAVLDSEAGGHEVLQLALAHEADLVVIDTMGRVIGGEENSADTFQAYYRWTGGPLKAHGIATIRLDHAGKNKESGQRGSSAKADDVDIVWNLEPKDAGVLDLTATHARMGWVPKVVHLKQRTEPLSYVMAEESWAHGTGPLVAVLDGLGVPAEAGRETARKALTEAQSDHPNDSRYKASNALLASAVKWRRREFDRLISTSSLAAS